MKRQFLACHILPSKFMCYLRLILLEAKIGIFHPSSLPLSSKGKSLVRRFSTTSQLLYVYWVAYSHTWKFVNEINIPTYLISNNMSLDLSASSSVINMNEEGKEVLKRLMKSQSGLEVTMVPLVPPPKIDPNVTNTGEPATIGPDVITIKKVLPSPQDGCGPKRKAGLKANVEGITDKKARKKKINNAASSKQREIRNAASARYRLDCKREKVERDGALVYETLRQPALKKKAEKLDEEIADYKEKIQRRYRCQSWPGPTTPPAVQVQNVPTPGPSTSPATTSAETDPNFLDFILDQSFDTSMYSLDT